jgi:hypothetical protein
MLLTNHERTEPSVSHPAVLGERRATEYMTVTALDDGRRYIAIFRKWFNEKLGAWEMEIVPGTLRWLD